MQTFALLGAHPELSLAEIKVVTGDTANARFGNVAVFDDVSWGDLPTLQEKLGGTQKLGAIIATFETIDVPMLATLMAEDLANRELNKKIPFGISVYGGNEAHKLREATRKLGFEVKSILKERGVSARFVVSKEPTLSSVVLKKNGLLSGGAEFVLLPQGSGYVLGVTEAAQDVDSWSHRDFGRPRRNAKQGMFPPKLARMLLNLTGKRIAGASVFDPFCGSGTVLMEAAVLGATRLVGSDISDTAVEDTKKNLAWLSGTVPMHPPELHVSDARDVSSLITTPVDIIVTETYLGRPRKGVETRAELQETISYVERLYRDCFTKLRDVLTDDGVIVLTSPKHFLSNGESFELPTVQIMEDIGYYHAPVTPDELLYKHKEQMVGRQIFRFLKHAPKKGGPASVSIWKKAMGKV